MKKRILISIVAIALCFVICLVTTASTPVSTVTAFIDEELKAVMENAADDELIPVDIWIAEIDTTEVENAVMKKVGNTKETLLNAKSATHSQVDAYIEAERKIYAEMQTEKSQTFLNKYDGIFNSRNSSEEKLTYVSKYAPVISAKLTIKEIQHLSKDLSVEAVYYAPDLVAKNFSNISFPLVRSDYVRDTLGYSGTGIKIGMIEFALPDPNVGYFNASNIIIQPNVVQSSNAEHKAHANLVASIMVAKATTVDGVTYKGILPNAKLYATNFTSSSDLRPRVEWLLSQGVNVINLSAGIIGAGFYSTLDKWFDHIAINHSVHVVVAAGNYAWDEFGNFIQYSDHTCTPGMAYNVITVGNLNDNGTSSQDNDEIHAYSSYIESRFDATKPDIVAPGTNITTAAGTGTGTSFAAPHVTAIVAQLCQAYPALKSKQDAMKAILMASIAHSEHAYTPYSDNFDRYGAGMIDARSSLYTTENSRYVSSSFEANTDDAMKTYTFNVTSSDERIRVALAWLKYNRFSSGTSHTNDEPDTNASLANLCLWIYDPDGRMVAQSYIDYGNVQIVDFVPTKYGTYRIEVDIWEDSTSKTYFGLAWW